MAAKIFRALSFLRFAIETETDADSPDNETTYPAIREAIEMLFKLCFSDGFTSTASANPPDDNTGVLTHAGAAQDVDEHNGRTLLITSGLARGDPFTIDATAAQTITCTGDNLFAAGVRSGDDFEIFYDIKTNSDGHDHDDVNSKPVQGVAAGAIDEAELASGAVAQAKLKTAMSSVTDVTAGIAAYTLPGGEYGFYPQIKVEDAGGPDDYLFYIGGTANPGASYATIIGLSANSENEDAFAQQRYITASGEVHWIWVWMKNGKLKGMVQAPDHPGFGNRGCVHPFPNFDPAKDEIIVVNPSLNIVEEINAGMLPAEGGGFLTVGKIAAGVGEDYLAPTLDFLEVFNKQYEIEGGKQADWPDIPVTIALPRIYKGRVISDWRFMPTGTILKPIKRVIPRPEYITPVQIRKKEL